MSNPTQPAPATDTHAMPDYITRLNDIADLACLALESGQPGSYEYNARHEIHHALVVEVPVMIADALDAAQRARDDEISKAVIAGYLYAIGRLQAMGDEIANDGYERSYAIGEGFANKYVSARASLPPEPTS